MPLDRSDGGSPKHGTFGDGNYVIRRRPHTGPSAKAATTVRSSSSSSSSSTSATATAEEGDNATVATSSSTFGGGNYVIKRLGTESSTPAPATSVAPGSSVAPATSTAKKVVARVKNTATFTNTPTPALAPVSAPAPAHDVSWMSAPGGFAAAIRRQGCPCCNPDDPQNVLDMMLSNPGGGL